MMVCPPDKSIKIYFALLRARKIFFPFISRAKSVSLWVLTDFGQSVQKSKNLSPMTFLFKSLTIVSTSGSSGINKSIFLFAPNRAGVDHSNSRGFDYFFKVGPF